MSELRSLADYLNKDRRGPQRVEIRKDLQPLVTLPDACVVTGAKRLSSLSPGTRSAYASSYAASLERLLGKIQSVLRIQLRIALGTTKLLRHDEGVFPPNSEIAWVSRRLDSISNPDYVPHIAKGRGLIRTWVGNFIVIGNVPPLRVSKCGRRYWYGVIAKSLVSGKFYQLRICRLASCQMAFLSGNIRKAYCSRKCENVYTTRYAVAKHRAKEREEIKRGALRCLTILAKAMQKSGRDKLEEMVLLPPLSAIRVALGEKWDRLEPVFIKMGGGLSPKDALQKLPIGIRKQLAEMQL